MNSSELKQLEKLLENAEDLFTASRGYSLQSEKIWNDLRDLIQRVATERLRAEIQERKDRREFR